MSTRWPSLLGVWGLRLAIALAAALTVAGRADAEIHVFSAQLLPTHEVPLVTNADIAAFGVGTVILEVTRDSSNAIVSSLVRFDIRLAGVPPGDLLTAAHIHQGPPGVIGPIVVDTGLSPTSPVVLTSGLARIQATATADAVLTKAILDVSANFYLNVHTNINAGGAVRGPLTPFRFLRTTDDRAAFVGRIFQQLLGRDVDPVGLAFGIAALATGMTRTQVAAAILASTEYRQGLVQDAYQSFLGRAADPAGVNAGLGLLIGGATDLARTIEDSNESRARVVDDAYTFFLGRPADAGGLNFGLNLLVTGGTFEQLYAAILGSGEYFQRVGATNPSFVAALYQDLLGRPTDPGSQFFLDQLNTGVLRTQVATQVLLSTEHLTRLVGSYYTRFLGRPADPAAVAFVNALRVGALRDEDVIASLLASDEYFGRFVAP
jgi:hypothetical protein